MIRKLVFAAVLATSIGGVATLATIATPAAAAVMVQVAPPPPREEVVPAPRRGYVWRGGYWDWKGSRHQWVKGTWIKERRGYVYTQPNWVERGGRWQMERGGWKRGDRDGDGVPNRADRAPDNPRRN